MASSEIAIAKHAGKLRGALGIDPQNTAEALSAAEVDAALGIERDRYSLAVLDLNSEFARRRDLLRREHLQRVAEIATRTEEA